MLLSLIFRNDYVNFTKLKNLRVSQYFQLAVKSINLKSMVC